MVGFSRDLMLAQRNLSEAGRSDRIACVSQSALRELNDFFPVALGRSSVVLSGHDQERFRIARRHPSDISSMPEVGGIHVFYCDPCDPFSIAQATAAAMALEGDKREIHLSQAAGRAANFTWDTSAQQLADLIEDAVAEKGRRLERNGTSPVLPGFRASPLYPADCVSAD